MKRSDEYWKDPSASPADVVRHARTTLLLRLAADWYERAETTEAAARAMRLQGHQHPGLDRLAENDRRIFSLVRDEILRRLEKD